jgi:hypothetical protein
MRGRVGNLVMACLAVLFFAGEWADWGWAGSPWWQGKPPFRPPPLDVWTFLQGFIVVCWLSGAIGLFYRKQLALIGSLLGLGAYALLFSRLLACALWLFAFPTAELKKIYVTQGFGIGEIFGEVFLITVFSVPLGILLNLFVKLVRGRKELQ